jgi:hypothetical protein
MSTNPSRDEKGKPSAVDHSEDTGENRIWALYGELGARTFRLQRTTTYHGTQAELAHTNFKQISNGFKLPF